MCQAVQEMCDDARAEGRTQGVQRVKVLGFRNRRCLQHRKCSKTADLHWKVSLIFPDCQLDEIKKLQMK